MRTVPLLLAAFVALSACSSVPQAAKPDPEWIVIGATQERTYEVAMKTLEFDTKTSSSQFMMRTKLNTPVKTEHGNIASVVGQMVVICGEQSAVISAVRISYDENNVELAVDPKPETYIDSGPVTSTIHRIAMFGCVPFRNEKPTVTEEDWRKSA